MSELQTARRSKRGNGFVLTERDRRLLEAVARFRLVSRDQAMVLAPFGSLTRANTRLALLVESQLLSRKMLPVFPGKGSAQALYHLGPASRTVLNNSSVTEQVRRIARWDLRIVAHVTTANQVLVDFIRRLEKRPEEELLAYRTEVELRGVFVERDLVPDGWVAWRQTGKRFNAFLEVDLHHEGLTAWRKKILAYQNYLASGLHQDLFGFKACRVLVLAKSRARLAHLRQLADVAGRLCLFATFETIKPENILDSVWLPAWGVEPIALQEA